MSFGLDFNTLLNPNLIGGSNFSPDAATSYGLLSQQGAGSPAAAPAAGGGGGLLSRLAQGFSWQDKPGGGLFEDPIRREAFFKKIGHLGHGMLMASESGRGMGAGLGLAMPGVMGVDDEVAKARRDRQRAAWDELDARIKLRKEEREAKKYERQEERELRNQTLLSELSTTSDPQRRREILTELDPKSAARVELAPDEWELKSVNVPGTYLEQQVLYNSKTGEMRQLEDGSGNPLGPAPRAAAPPFVPPLFGTVQVPVGVDAQGNPLTQTNVVDLRSGQPVRQMGAPTPRGQPARDQWVTGQDMDDQGNPVLRSGTFSPGTGRFTPAPNLRGAPKSTVNPIEAFAAGLLSDRLGGGAPRVVGSPEERVDPNAPLSPQGQRVYDRYFYGP